MAKYWAGGHWERGRRIIPNKDAYLVMDLVKDRIHSILDLCCGDGNILDVINNNTSIKCYGIDLFKDNFEDSPRLEKEGVNLKMDSLENTISNDYKLTDCIVMRNTFGTRHINNLNSDLEKWIFNNFKYFVCQKPTNKLPEGPFHDYYSSHLNRRLHFSKYYIDFSIVDDNELFYLMEINND